MSVAMIAASRRSTRTVGITPSSAKAVLPNPRRSDCSRQSKPSALEDYALSGCTACKLQF